MSGLLEKIIYALKKENILILFKINIKSKMKRIKKNTMLKIEFLNMMKRNIFLTQFS